MASAILPTISSPVKGLMWLDVDRKAACLSSSKEKPNKGNMRSLCKAHSLLCFSAEMGQSSTLLQARYSMVPTICKKVGGISKVSYWYLLFFCCLIYERWLRWTLLAQTLSAYILSLQKRPRARNLTHQAL